MVETSIHNPDRYMIDLRQILSQGRKRIGLFIGAGAPVSLKVNDAGQLSDKSDAKSIIPDVAGLTSLVLAKLNDADKDVIAKLFPASKDSSNTPNIEDILTKIRRLSQAIGSSKVHDLDGNQYEALASRICGHIGGFVAPRLPEGTSPYTELISWIGGINREHAVEIFTPNYDLLLEEAFERAKFPYFDGFTGAYQPFFDPASLNDDSLPTRWSRIWKIHGSLGWKISNSDIIRTGDRAAADVIYPEHLKYDHIARQPYSALFERLRNFLSTPDTLLICCGFSFADPHITSVFDEALSANAHSAILAFQYGAVSKDSPVAELALKRPNVSVYGNDSAIISGVHGNWVPGKSPSDEWTNIRRTFWSADGDSGGKFVLGNFVHFAKFFALTSAGNIAIQDTQPSGNEATVALSNNNEGLDTNATA